MNEYDISNYDIFSSAIDSTNAYLNRMDSLMETITSCQTKLSDTSIFMGPIQSNCMEVFAKLNENMSNIENKYKTLSSFLDQTATAYKGGDQSASNTVSSSTDGSLSTINVNKYHSKPESGFNVTTGNKTYNVSDSDRDFLYGIVSAESDQSYDDALAVISVILNRSESSAFISEFGGSPVAQCKGANQFSVYSSGAYRSYTNGNAPSTVQEAVDDALQGVRNNQYLGFRSNNTTGYSNNMITNTGNRYS